MDSSGNEIINAGDCHFGLIGEAVDVGLGDATDGADILANNLAETNPCGFGVVGGPDPAFNGLVDLNSDMTITAADSCENCFFRLDLDNGFVVVNVPQPTTCPGFAGNPRNQVVGTAGDDILTGTPGADIICGKGGSGTLSGLGGNDLLLGALGNDRLGGGSGRDRLVGASGRDRLFAGPARDGLFGGPGRCPAPRPGSGLRSRRTRSDTFRRYRVRRPYPSTIGTRRSRPARAGSSHARAAPSGTVVEARVRPGQWGWSFDELLTAWTTVEAEGFDLVVLIT